MVQNVEEAKFSVQQKGLFLRNKHNMPRKIVAPATFVLKIKNRISDKHQMPCLKFRIHCTKGNISLRFSKYYQPFSRYEFLFSVSFLRYK